MQSAKRAGWEMVCWSSLLILMLVITHFTKIAVSDVVILDIRPLAIAIGIISTPIWIALIICLFYSVWGLQCGYSQEAWNKYAKQCDDQTRAEIKKICAEENIAPPNWL
jgi:hypothetical protein